MAEAKVYSIEGKETGSVKLAPSVFEAEISLVCIREVLNQYQANQRAGTACAKSRHFVRGGGAKPWRQKGTGRARAGSNRSPLWRGGAVLFGPSPRDYETKVNRKKRRRAFISALSSYAGESRVFVLEKAELSQPRTRDFSSMIKNMDIEGKILFIMDTFESNFILSGRNIPNVSIISVDNINIYDLVNHDNIVLTRNALKKVEETLG